MGAFVAAPAFIYGTLAAATAATVYTQRQEAGAQQVELNLAARQEQQAAGEREVARKRRVAAILGAQSSAAAASGIAMSGSVANISLTDAKRAAEDSFTDDANTRLRIDALRRRRSSISQLSNVRSATTILSGVERAAQRAA